MRRSQLIELLNSIEIKGHPDPQVRFEPVDGLRDVETHSAYISREVDFQTREVKETIPPYIVLRECLQPGCELCTE